MTRQYRPSPVLKQFLQAGDAADLLRTVDVLHNHAERARVLL
jgi:hypothetical protein